MSNIVLGENGIYGDGWKMTGSAITCDLQAAEHMCLTPALTMRGLKQLHLTAYYLISRTNHIVRVYLNPTLTKQVKVESADKRTLVEIIVKGIKMDAEKILPVGFLALPNEDTSAIFSIDADDSMVNPLPQVLYDKENGILNLVYSVKVELQPDVIFKSIEEE